MVGRGIEPFVGRPGIRLVPVRGYHIGTEMCG